MSRLLLVLVLGFALGGPPLQWVAGVLEPLASATNTDAGNRFDPDGQPAANAGNQFDPNGQPGTDAGGQFDPNG